MNREKLETYCKDHGIFVPTGATVAYLQAAIVRAYQNGHAPKNPKDCFGYWEYENSTCGVCDFEKLCSSASLGMDKDLYFKKVESAENPKLRFAKSLRTKK